MAKRVFPPEWYAAQAARRKNKGEKIESTKKTKSKNKVFHSKGFDEEDSYPTKKKKYKHALVSSHYSSK